MNREKMLSTVLLYSVFLFALFSLHHKSRWGSHYSSYDYMMDALSAIAVSLGSVGAGELRQGGHRKINYFLFGSAFIWFVICSFLLFFFKRPMREPVVDLLFGGAALLFAAQFPVALYMNRNQSKSTSQQTSANAS
ncbi:MAG: hypothetical protein ABSE51_13025 [Terracidiphilus sp.]|jgi:hypothetical protein